MLYLTELPPILVKICVSNISYKLKGKEDVIIKNAQGLFPKTSEQGRLKVELGASNSS